MCSKTKTKSKTSSKASKKRGCHVCTARKITREELDRMYMPPIPMPMMDQNQTEGNYGYGYCYGDRLAWENNYPAMITRGQWRDHTQTTQNAYKASQENGKTISEMKSAIASDVKEVHEAIKETHASVNSTDSRVKDTRDAIDLAQASINSTHTAVKEAQAAIQKTQEAIHNGNAEHMSKQEACAVDIARVRQLLEEEVKKREETRRMEEMVRYAQSQGLLQTQAQAQTDRDRGHGNSSSSQSSSSTASSLGREQRERANDSEKRAAAKRRQWELLEHQQQLYQAQKMQEMADAQVRLLEEQERWPRPNFLGRRGAYFHHHDVVEAPPYVYSYAEYAGHRGARLPRRM
ncbi:hypothetical protein EKO27_g4208 [Xylaria grammica]|uniref:Uncharacterized protein n=1 Tax=Xylaria grammica TaxID=363999 RepID=A0A439D903_9PEZI|nr:hypothetical protein EKO27_g4208 [Xylaria grammica]